MTTGTTAAEREYAALKRVENAARRVLRYPGDHQPRHQLMRAIRNLDQTRKDNA